MIKQKSEPVNTVLTIVLGFLLLYLFTKWKWTLTLSVVIGMAGLISRHAARAIDFLWMKLAYLLSLVVPNIVFSIIFFLILFPVALLSKLFGQKNKLMLKNNIPSTFVNSNKSFSKESFEKPW